MYRWSTGRSLGVNTVLGVQFFYDIMHGLLFADDFVGVAEMDQVLQSLVDRVHNYSKIWRFEANIKKSAVMVFPKLEDFSGQWVWG